METCCSVTPAYKRYIEKRKPFGRFCATHQNGLRFSIYRLYAVTTLQVADPQMEAGQFHEYRASPKKLE